MPQERSKKRIIIFTRYPEAGKTKTRLIPAVGAEMAAQIQRQMSEHTLAQVRTFQVACDRSAGPVSIEVRFTGGSLAQMQAWLGNHIIYQPQETGDLGDRMASAFQASFAAGNDRVVIIGIDCPGINPQLLDQAFQILQDHDLVLGPAVDGGYYLIGLRLHLRQEKGATKSAHRFPVSNTNPSQDSSFLAAEFPKELFQNISWGSSEVLEKTVAIAQKIPLSYCFLPELPDIDRPEDLGILRQYNLAIPGLDLKFFSKNESPNKSESETLLKTLPKDNLLSPQVYPQPLENSGTKISIIIPVLNEAPAIAATLQAAQTGHHLEIIVVDGGSVDGTLEIAKTCGVRVLTTTAGRAHQMNVGAAIATGEILLFLHGDTRLSKGFDTWVRQILQRPDAIAGAFELHIDSPQKQLRYIETAVQWRSRWLQMPYGDQGIFMTKKIFNQIGGFPEIPIMEDFELIRGLKKYGKIAIAPLPVLTSPRRWHKLGIFKTTLLNQLIVISYLLGVSPDQLVQWYRSRPNPENSS